MRPRQRLPFLDAWIKELTVGVPAIKLVAWQCRHPDWCFVAVPNERGRYLRTDLSVVYVACPYCNAVCGEPCKGVGNGRYTSGTHVARRNQYQTVKRANRTPGLGALRDVEERKGGQSDACGGNSA